MSPIALTVTLQSHWRSCRRILGGGMTVGGRWWVEGRLSVHLCCQFKANMALVCYPWEVSCHVHSLLRAHWVGCACCQLEAGVPAVGVLRVPHGWFLFQELQLQPRCSGLSDLSQLLEKMLLLCATYRREETVQKHLEEVMLAPHSSSRDTVRPLPVSSAIQKSRNKVWVFL